MGMLFKTSVFGGFRKKEVIEYIEKLKSDCARETQDLRDDLARLERDEKDATQLAEGKDQRISQLEVELQEARQQQQALQDAAEAAQSDAAAARQQAETVKREYSELKEYIADIEVSAYKRAREVQEEAARHAQEVTKTIQTAGAVMSPVAEEAREKVELAEEAFTGFKSRIDTITVEIDELVKAMNAIEERSRHVAERPVRAPVISDSQPAAGGPRLRSIQEILDRVKNIGEKM